MLTKNTIKLLAISALTAATTALLAVNTTQAGKIDRFLNTAPTQSFPAGEDIIANLRTSRHDADAMKTRIATVSDMPFTTALEIDVTRTAKYTNMFNMYIKTKRPVQKGDVIFLTFYTKCIRSENDTAGGLIVAAFGSGYPSHVFEQEFASTGKWTRVYTHAVSPADYPPGKAALRFSFGYNPQKILIADIRLINFGKTIGPDTLPTMEIRYEGMEPDAKWRKDALKRIDQHRKTDISITVVDDSGQPVKNANVSVKLTRHAFAFGGTYRAKMHTPGKTDIDLDTFQKHFKQLFNTAVLPNALKWKHYATEGQTSAPQAYQWLKANNFDIRGHNLIWPGWNFLPPWVKNYEDDPAKLRRLTMEHIEEVLTEWKGRLIDWDVVNEVYRQHDLLDICGDEILIDWFKLARRLDPKTKLYYNDANVLVNNQPGHRDHYYETIKWLLEKQAPVDGMGFQCHVHSLVPPEVTYKRIERFAALGPEIQITEFDIQTPGISDELQAQYARDFMTAVFSHPKTTGIITWLGGNPLREDPRNTSRGQCAFYSQDWTIKPLGQTWLDLKNNQWNTNTTGTTDNRGTFKTRAFHGQYDITITNNGKVKKTETTIGKHDKTIKVRL
ncbi:MAG: endo-1,4-beta-xylanase [Planctomycetes bacterium]|nr:endo-1,4-beta-xylanase [Planctomycetota bacterium]